MQEVTSTWITGKFLEAIRIYPSYKISTLVQELLKQCGIEEKSKQKLYKAKRKALNIVGGDHAASYKLLNKYAHMLPKKKKKVCTHAYIKESRYSGIN